MDSGSTRQAEEPIRPSSRYYVLAAGLFALGIGVAIWGFGRFFPSLPDRDAPDRDDRQRVVVPGAEDIKVAEPGKHVIYHEYFSSFDGKTYANEPALPGLQCTLVEAATGGKIRLKPPRSSARYGWGACRGTALFDFEAERPGTYHLTASYPPDRPGPEAVLAIGPLVESDHRTFMRPFFEVWLWMPLVWLCFLAGLIILIITALRRGACKTRRMPPPPWAVSPGPERPDG